ncbi:hypothetical protein B0H15DRAFT_835629 [Mycena belliarum]|uniref:DUF7330 domain-containing protein n=1 Tax=Mycena belliarum TaxID=1033014 RepID=A0AAD6U6Y1_9AGAR|nr:hypothetical protein B0H15DRAFT_835629 [Mycena belliae]
MKALAGPQDEEVPPYQFAEQQGGVTKGPKPVVVTALSQSSSSSQPPSAVHKPQIALPPGSFGSFSRLNLRTRWANISGTYYIAAQNPSSQIISRRQRRKQKIRIIPDAIFRTNRGNLNLDLATTGNVNEAPKASVSASTIRGKISINLIPGAESRPRFDLEASSRSGDIVLFVPNTFAGAIQLHTKTGDLDFLPGIASNMQVMRSTDTEYLVFVGNKVLDNRGKSRQPGRGQDVADFCRLRTVSGSIIVGERGKDTYVKEQSVWQRMTGFLRG